MNMKGGLMLFSPMGGFWKNSFECSLFLLFAYFAAKRGALPFRAYLKGGAFVLFPIPLLLALNCRLFFPTIAFDLGADRSVMTAESIWLPLFVCLGYFSLILSGVVFSVSTDQVGNGSFVVRFGIVVLLSMLIADGFEALVEPGHARGVASDAGLLVG